MLPWPRFAGDRTQPQSAGASAGPVCVQAAASEGRSAPKGSSLSWQRWRLWKMWLALYILYGSSHPSGLLLCLNCAIFVAVVYFLVRLLHGHVSSWERGSLLYTAPAESGIHSTDWQQSHQVSFHLTRLIKKKVQLLSKIIQDCSGIL